MVWEGVGQARGREGLLRQHPTPANPLPTCYRDWPHSLGAPGLAVCRKGQGLTGTVFGEVTGRQKPFLWGFSLPEV